ncbi:MAG TPA: tail fiber domain-containing protein [Longimicrobium sp.]|jgi:hypothetical protein
MTKTWFRAFALLLGCAAAAPAAARAQTDSVFAVTRSGESFLRVNVDGKVGIGTSTPDRRLTVNGSLRADSVVATAGVKFPDGSVQTTAAGSASGTSVNTPSTLVARDASGAFAAGWVTLRQLTVSDNEANGGASTRLQVRSGSNLGSRFLVDSAGGLVAGGSLGIGIIPAEGEGYRMMWHPYRASFRAGGVSGEQWNDANIGFFSVAFGQNVQAEGNWSIAAGHSAFTDQPYSVSMGFGTHANGQAAIALGYRATADANYAVAIGRAVSADGHEGAIVIGDGSTSDSLQATAANQFSLRANGGIRLFTNSAKTAGVLFQAYPGSASTPWTCSNVHWVISASNCAYLSQGGAWTNVSDVNRKHGFAAVRGDDVLARLRRMPITTWTYNSEGNGVRHLGPTAQDFHAAFGLGGADNTHITTVDADGVALAAAQALEARTTAQQTRIEAVERDNAALRAENAELRARLERIEAALAAQGTAPKP